MAGVIYFQIPTTLIICLNIRVFMTEQHIDNWQAKKEHLRKRFPELTEDDLRYQIGKEEELLERLQKKLDKDEDEIRKWLSWMG